MIKWLKKIFMRKINLNSLDKNELEAIGRELGIELDKRRKKETLIKQIQEVL